MTTGISGLVLYVSCRTLFILACDHIPFFFFFFLNVTKLELKIKAVPLQPL